MDELPLGAAPEGLLRRLNCAIWSGLYLTWKPALFRASFRAAASKSSVTSQVLTFDLASSLVTPAMQSEGGLLLCSNDEHVFNVKSVTVPETRSAVASVQWRLPGAVSVVAQVVLKLVVVARVVQRLVQAVVLPRRHPAVVGVVVNLLPILLAVVQVVMCAAVKPVAGLNRGAQHSQDADGG